MKLDRIVIKANDYRKSFDFYHDILGLKLKNSWQRADSWGALFFCGEALIELIWYPEGEGNTECSYIPEFNKTEIFLSVNDVDSLYDKLKRYEQIRATRPEDKSWGHRIFKITDPDNVKIIFSQPI